MIRLFVITSLLLTLTVGIVSAQQDVPYESEDHFEMLLDYTFKVRTPPDRDKISLVQTDTYSAQPLPYLKVKFAFSGLPEAYYRFKVENIKGDVIKNKKFKSASETYVLDMGFSDDLKDQVTSYKYTIFFLTKTKDVLSKIDVEVEENGNFLLNGEFHGRI